MIFSKRNRVYYIITMGDGTSEAISPDHFHSLSRVLPRLTWGVVRIRNEE